ncbi:MAG TPA: hypothetical protein VMZ31_01010 [Phycisphaerae bacterium]|nr:hypothetical protein [Phycisphaerae bacterium]
MFIHTEATLDAEQADVMRVLADEPGWTSPVARFESIRQVRLTGKRRGHRPDSVIPPRISVLLAGRLWQASVAVTVYGLAHGRSRVFLNATIRGPGLWFARRTRRRHIQGYLEDVLAGVSQRIIPKAAASSTHPPAGSQADQGATEEASEPPAS